jgi:transposase
MPRGKLSEESYLKQSNTKLMKTVTELRATMKGMETTIKEQAMLIKELEAKLEDKESQRKQLLSYLYKPNREKGEGKKLGKKQGAIGYQRPKPKDEEVTEYREFPLTHCTTCKELLGKPADTAVKYEEDIDLAPRKIIRKYTIPRYWCKRCQEFIRSPMVPPITRIGPNVMGYILYARYRLRLPMRKLRESLDDIHNFKISEGEVAEKLQEAETLFGKDYAAISELIQTARVVYADETGWRMHGHNWWLWVYATDKGIRYVLEHTRGKGIPQDALGKQSDRVIVSDGYAVYKNLPGDKQQCWVHLLRNAKFTSPLLYQDLADVYTKLTQELTKEIENRRPEYFNSMLSSVIQKTYEESAAQKVQARIRRHQEPLLTCLKYKNVLPENNTAERALRNSVVMRKIFGGSRSPNGAKAHEVNNSVIDTMRIQNPNSSFFDAMIPLIKKRIEENQGKLYNPPSES